jgi:hypothetical protein
VYGTPLVFHDGFAHWKWITLGCWTLNGCLHDILPWSDGDVWTLVTSSFSRHMKGGCLLGGCLALDEECWAFQRGELSPRDGTGLLAWRLTLDLRTLGLRKRTCRCGGP